MVTIDKVNQVADLADREIARPECGMIYRLRHIESGTIIAAVEVKEIKRKGGQLLAVDHNSKTYCVATLSKAPKYRPKYILVPIKVHRRAKPRERSSTDLKFSPNSA